MACTYSTFIVHQHFPGSFIKDLALPVCGNPFARLFTIPRLFDPPLRESHRLVELVLPFLLVSFRCRMVPVSFIHSVLN